ncbi:MAG: 2-polyprenyl-3-methyl-6-methoxy-1,4-benzoquinone monooxygenase [Gammaproteobacteria bacterium]
MPERHYDTLDRMILGLDRGLRTIFGRQSGSERTNPADGIEDYPLSKSEQRLSGGLMRVNHAGEVSAQALYQGQGLSAGDPGVRASMKQSAAEEVDHLHWCEQRIGELGGHTSYLNPLWYLGSFTIGAIAGLCGDKWSLGFIAETERQVVRHLQGHLQRIPGGDLRSRAIIEQMQADEGHHATVALAAGAAELPGAVKQAMRLTSRVMTGTAYWI